MSPGTTLAPQGVRAPRRRRRFRNGASRRSARWREDLAGWGFVSFALAIVGVFLAGAVGYMAYLSLTSYSGFGSPEYVGLRNYRFIFEDPAARKALINTLIIVGVTVPVVVVASVSIALLLWHEFPGVRILRAAYFLPAVVSIVVATAIFRALYEYPSGVLNTLLDAVSLSPIGWYTDAKYALAAVILLEVWREVPFFSLILLAALQDTPRDLLDAARVDGASALRRVWHVVLPHLRPVILFTVVLSTIFGFRTFAEPNVLTNGGPGDATRTVALYAYDNAFQFQRFGYASALTMLLLVVILLVSVALLRLGDDR